MTMATANDRGLSYAASTDVRDRLLAVDDEAGICELLAEVAEGMGFAARTLTDPTKLLAEIVAFQPTVIVLDLQMPAMDGITLLRQLAEVRCEANILLLSGVDARTLSTAERLGKAQGLRMLGRLSKPVEVAALEAMLEAVRQSEGGILPDDLRRAIEADEFYLAYQPKMALSGDSERVHAVEALIRWPHPRLGTVMPADFIPLAERTGLIAPLTHWVLREAARQMRRWADAGTPIGVAVNISSCLLDDLSLPDRIAAIFEAQGVAGNLLTLEVTETAAMANACKSMDILTRFRLKDFAVSIDDFGTGYSSLVQLFRLPFSEVKIDKSFTLELDSSEEARVIARSIVDLARNLKLSVCAEGVETRFALDYLRAMGCDTAQGYLIGRPMRAADLDAVIGQPLSLDG